MCICLPLWFLMCLCLIINERNYFCLDLELAIILNLFRIIYIVKCLFISLPTFLLHFSHLMVCTILNYILYMNFLLLMHVINNCSHFMIFNSFFINDVLWWTFHSLWENFKLMYMKIMKTVLIIRTVNCAFPLVTDDDLSNHC